MIAYTFLTSALVASTALAHFTLDFPQTRGFDEDLEPQFCGGFNQSATRQPFGLGSSPIWIDSHHTLATVDAFLSVKQTPTSFDDFNTTSNGTVIPMVTNFFQVGQGEFCWNVDMSKLNIGLTNGSLVTLQVQFNGGDGNLFQCTDLVLLSNFTAPSNFTCTKDAAAAFSATAAIASATSKASSSTGSATVSATSAASTSAKSGGIAGKEVGSWSVAAALVVTGLAGLSVL